MRPPFQISSARPVTVLRSPSPRQRPLCYIHFTSRRPFGLLTLKARAVFQRPRWCDLQRYEDLFLWVPRYEVIALAAHLAGLRCQSKFIGAATGATAGAAACATRSSVNLSRADFHSSGLGSPTCQTNRDQGSFVCSTCNRHRADMFGVPSEARLHVRAHADVFIRHKKRHKLMLFDWGCVFLDHGTWPVVQRTE